jgi:hypothetical protein
MKIYQEITEWDEKEYAVPNHVYLMDGDKVYAYSKQGKETPHYFKTFLRINRRGRKFVELKNNPWKFKIQKPEPVGREWAVAGSKGNTYTVTEENETWSCTCSGFVFRGQCRHITETKSSLDKQI